MAFLRKITCGLILGSLSLVLSFAGSLHAAEENPATRESTLTQDGVRLAYKRYARPGAVPVVVLAGWTQNDRFWDPKNSQYSMARYLHGQGFDVWLGNRRGEGTPGFRSQTPKGPRHWTVDDFVVYDLPALIRGVIEKTGQRPLLVGHSMVGWMLEGYLAGVRYNERHELVADPLLARWQQATLRGASILAGAYQFRWKNEFLNRGKNPVLNEEDFYQSNYEVEVAVRIPGLYSWVMGLDALPMGWVADILEAPVGRIPWVGPWLERLYSRFQEGLVTTPVFATLYYPNNVDRGLVRKHAEDGLEDLGPRVVIQIANGILDQELCGFYDRRFETCRFSYTRNRVAHSVPIQFFAGTHDRMASRVQVVENGYNESRAEKKELRTCQRCGHMDIATGLTAKEQVWKPVADWLMQLR